MVRNAKMNEPDLHLLTRVGLKSKMLHDKIYIYSYLYNI